MSNPDTEDDEEVEHETVRVIGCDIYFYGDVDRANAFDFIDAFKKLEVDLLKKSIELEGYNPMIRVHIHSDGGDVFSGLSMMDMLRSSRVKVVTIAEGTCCSAATLILLGGCKRLMGRHAFVLIHQLSTGFFGKYKDLKDEMKTCKKVMATLKTLYDDSTTIPKDKLSEFMKRDIYLGYEECLKYEIVHGHS
jgi:ATP-dependent protease ClpP protease subunit|tara:strand:- start:121 stop:696 length:576 start_codon:yes stop_codon:yes gene_type:complete